MKNLIHKNIKSIHPCGAGYKLICTYFEKYSLQVRIFRGEACISKFLDSIYDVVDYCKNIIREHFNKPLKMTRKDEKAFLKATDLPYM